VLTIATPPGMNPAWPRERRRSVLPDPIQTREVIPMSARQKLNTAYIQGGLIVATVIGALAQSWVVFTITAAVLMGLSLLGGEIRPTRRRR